MRVAALREFFRDGLFPFCPRQFHLHQLVVRKRVAEGSNDRLAHAGIADEDDGPSAVRKFAQVTSLKAKQGLGGGVMGAPR